ncbi:hypothetical protein B0H11DRAFT_2257746 [Mycena galericulata]|nr:hypothetical protein B0H11DRAFT_2264891 [Mycena galericulata]KAJ7435051.1 hypothetical protein B0H11DRAFT_2257746 [Mycena galericulata]
MRNERSTISTFSRPFIFRWYLIHTYTGLFFPLLIEWLPNSMVSASLKLPPFSPPAPESQFGRPDAMDIDRPGFGGACAGLDLEWPEDLSFRLTFPFHRCNIHGDEGDLPFDIEIHDRGRVVTVWSKRCRKQPNAHSHHCHECDALRGRLEDLAQIARKLRELLMERNEELNKLKLECLNLGRRLSTFARKMDDFERLIMAIANNDVPRIHAIIETAMRNGASVRTMANRIYDAFEGLHHTKGFTDFERDLGILIYRLGGRSLLYAMNHALNLPSLRTICNAAKFIKITPTIGPISKDEIRANIKNVMLVPRSESKISRAVRSGVSIKMDETAIEEQAVYFSHANQVGGLCQKHSSDIPGISPLTLATHDSALNIVDALGRGDVHFGKELAFVGAQCINESTLYPLLCAPTCKRETWEDMAALFRMILDVWDEAAKAAVGEIWDFSTDGDPLRRKAGHNVFVQIELKSGDALFVVLSGLPGLNLFTGPSFILMTFDWRHILKRLCTLLRHILADACSCFQVKMKHLSNAVVSLRKNRDIEFTVPTSEVDVNSDLDSIGLFSFMVEALLNAFIDPSASLTDQVRNLSIYAHMSFVLFRIFRLKFMSNQLYGDSQTMVKNIIFTIAKQQLLDPNGEVNAYNDGTDPVEHHFGYTRELGGHNSAMNFKQAVERTGWACDIHAVHERNPGLHAGHRRRNITRTEIKDHLNEHNFTGDLISGHCDLPGSWWDGRIETMRIFKLYSLLTPEQYDIPAILKSKLGLDFLRPFDGITYPGISDDADRSLPAATASSTVNNISEPSTTPESPALPLPAAAETEADFIDDMLPDPNLPAISFEEVLQSEESEPQVLKLEPRQGVRPEDYLRDESGKFVHKASICRLALNKEFVAKSKNRGQRAMGLAIKKVRPYTEPNGARALSGSITGSSFINVDLFITLVRTVTNISLASNIKLTGQILTLKAVQSRPEDLSAESGQDLDGSGWTWLWLGSYLMGTSIMKGTKIATDAPHILSIPGHLVEPINPMAVNAHDRLSVAEVQQINSTGTTWALDDVLLRTLIVQLWKRVEDTQTGLRELPWIKEVLNGFPYCWTTGIPALISEGGTTMLISEKSCPNWCLYCSEVPGNWRGHMGGHILRKIRGAGEVEREKKDKKAGIIESYPEVGEPYPCGFCGRSGQTDCTITMKPKGDGFEIHTKCRYAVTFQYASANKGSATTPSRNIPVICYLCPKPDGRYPTFPAVWRYNMAQHLLDQHSEYASPLQPEGTPLPFKVWENARVDKAEEKALGVEISPEFTQFSARDEADMRGEKRAHTSSAQSGAKRGRSRGA